ncbi:MAG: GNAT family N-acetyltransferase [Luteimonas sp.]
MSEHADDLPSAASDYPGDDLLRTRRLRLRGLRYADLFDLQALGRDPRVSARLLDAPVATLAQTGALVDMANRIYRQRPGFGLWRADDEHGRFIGFFSLMAECGDDAAEIGVRLLPRTWGRGYALEGGTALCDHAFAALRLTQLIGLCDPDNRSVPPLLMRLGFVADGTTRQFDRPALRFRLLRERWTGPRARRSG